ncbi:hypothetical protein C8F04DRAFT_1399524 [Mycena alexandri]|uniref:Uncharacterized protein n=1 Tax=Mycena alexandri TaxID=1745969 RepID=A0AAD6X022_9AGAR|nr:hypothetical protein C8F04DRAFT_1399524 [Mycena alexandri]
MSQSSGGSEQLPPDLRKQIEVSAYVFAGSTAVFAWDILNNLRGEYSLLSRHRLNTVTLIYYASRIASFIFVLGLTIFESYPLQDCKNAYTAFYCFYVIGVSGTAFLFFFRVRAIFNGERLPTIIFGCLWLAVLASSIALPIDGGAIGVGDPTVCIVASRHVSKYVAAGILITVHDTIVFFAISYRLNFQGEQQTPWEQVKALFSGANLPIFSKSLLVDSQMYYMITVVTNTVATVMIYVPGVSPLYHSFLIIPNVTLTSIMACRVYRNTKLGVTHGSAELTLPTLNTLGPNGNTIPPRVVQFSGQHTEIAGELHTGRNTLDSTEHEEIRTDIQLHLASRGKNYLSHPNDTP